MNVLGIDIGTKKIGLALYNTDTDIIMPLTTIEAKNCEESLPQYLEGYSIGLVIIGKPPAKKIEENIKRNLERILTILKDSKVEYKLIDESLTTQEIRDSARIQGYSWRKVKKLKQAGIIDKLSATKILERAKELGEI